MITQGKPLITINKNKYLKRVNESVFIPQRAVHRIENNYKQPVKIIEVQTGPILKESDIVRYQDIYGRIKWIMITLPEIILLGLIPLMIYCGLKKLFKLLVKRKIIIKFPIL